MNLISLLMTPYVIIVFFNNYFVYKIGFFKISEDVILMLLLAFLSFFIGTLFFRANANNQVEYTNYRLLNSYNLPKIKYYLYFVGILGILKAYFLYRQGVYLNDVDDEEGIMGNGIVAHLLLSTYAILPIYFLHWTYKKTISGFIPILLVLIVAFSSLIKYNVIGPILMLFIFISIHRPRLIKKASLSMGIFVVFLFVSNYAISFALSGSELEGSFLANHLWKYFAGSLIFDNYIFTSGIRVDTDIFYKLMSFIFALPNMFLNKFFDITLFPHVGQEMRDVSYIGEGSNVVDAVGYLYPSRGELSDVILFLIIIFFAGILFSYLYKRHMEKNNRYDTFLPNFLTYFVFLSFFAPYYVLTNPWETLVWALIFPPFFYRRNRKVAFTTNLTCNFVIK